MLSAGLGLIHFAGLILFSLALLQFAFHHRFCAAPKNTARFQIETSVQKAFP